MRLEDVIAPMDEADTPLVGLGVDLQPLDAELLQSGERARQMLSGRTQPTRYFVMDLRARLLRTYASETAEAADDHSNCAPSHSPRMQPEVRRRAFEPTAPAGLTQAVASAPPPVFVRMRMALFAAVILTGALILAALGSGLIPR
jgi:hypothetical protein